MGSDYAVSAAVGVVFMVAIVIMGSVVVLGYTQGFFKKLGSTGYPKISWNIDAISNTLTILQGSDKYTYASGSTPHLIFRGPDNVNYYVQDDLSLSTSTSNLRQTKICGGDVITGFTEGRWAIIWEPTNQILGYLDF